MTLRGTACLTLCKAWKWPSMTANYRITVPAEVTGFDGWMKAGNRPVTGDNKPIDYRTCYFTGDASISPIAIAD